MTTPQPFTIPVQVLPHGEGLPLPSYETDQAAGMDLAAAIDNGETMVIAPGKRALVPTGLTLELPAGFEAQIRPRSGLAFKKGITLLNAPGTIDADYRGEVGVLLINLGEEDFVIHRGDRVAQMVIAPVTQARLEAVLEVNDTARGAGGFGSTGVAAKEA